MKDYTQYNTKSNFLAKFTLFTVLLLAIITPVFIAGPISLYANNFAEFHSNLAEMQLSLIPFIILIPIISFFLSLFKRISSAVILILFWLALGFYIQGNFLVWDYGRFDGSQINWELHNKHSIIDISIWSLIALAIFALRSSILKNASFIASTLILLQITLSVFEFQNSKAIYNEIKNTKSSTKSLFSFSKERNILFIVLDEFSSRAFLAASNRDPELKSKWKDFTLYRDTLASFPTTYPSIPAMLTGKEIDPNGSMNSYLHEVIPNSLPVLIKSKGFYSDLVTFHPLCLHSGFDSCQPLNFAMQSDSKKVTRNESYKLLDLSLFRYTPNALKKIIYNDNAWFLQNDGLNKLTPNHKYSVQFASHFAKNSDANSDRPTFKFLHLLIPHAPYTLNSDCSRHEGKDPAIKTMYLNTASCALHLTGKIIEQIKNLNIYDQTSIYIIADHGTPIVFNNPGYGELVHRNLHRAYPLLLIKPAHQSANNSEMSINNEPKSITDIVEMTNELEKLDLPFAKSNHDKKRHYYNYAWKHDNWFSDKLPEITKFEIEGDSWDFKSWKKISK